MPIPLRPRVRSSAVTPYRWVSTALAACTLLAGWAVPSAADELAWSTLGRLRTALEDRSPLTVDFEQRLVPVGFADEDAEVESGTLAISLPRCLRWDYLGDFAKSFLLCDDEGRYWNPGEPAGQLYDLAQRADAPGLDFFLRTTDELELRYRAEAERRDGTVTVDLVPVSPSDDVVGLRVVVDAASGLLRELSYEDVEGNRTSFVLDSFRDGAAEGAFQVPEGMTWEPQ